MRRPVLVTVVTTVLFCTQIPAIAQTSLEVDVPIVVLNDVPFSMTITARNTEGQFLASFGDTLQISGVVQQDGSPPAPVFLRQGQAELTQIYSERGGAVKIQVRGQNSRGAAATNSIPAWLSLMPPVIAIAMALIVRQVLISLFAGIWLGAVFIYDFNLLDGFLRTLDTYFINALADPDHVKILVFSLTLGGMVGVISRGGGTRGIVDSLSRIARTAVSGQVATWMMGLLIFFDDYANSLIVGNTMRPITDRLRISREKLSYIVDSTAAPIAAIVPISTWVGYEVGLIDQAVESLNMDISPFAVFIAAIPYSTYSLLALVMVFAIAVSHRDFGPMLTAERRARKEGKVLSDTATPLSDASALEATDDPNLPSRWFNGLIPILTVVFVTITGLFISGMSASGDGASLTDIIGNADSYSALIWGSFAGLFTAFVMLVAQRILSINQAVDATVAGYRSMMMAALILTLAWAIGEICTHLHTADYIIHLTQNILSPSLLPILTFLIAGVVSFSTGSSWATMAIMIPIVVPLAHHLPIQAGLEPELAGEVLYGTIGAILAGVIFGDHCSPISDTTVLSSMASAADHIDHVRTQLPYAVSVAAIACVVGYIPAGFGWGGLNASGILLFALGVVLLLVLLRFVGQKVEE